MLKSPSKLSKSNLVLTNPKQLDAKDKDETDI